VLQIRQANKCDILDLVDLDDECFDTYYYEKTKFSKLDFKNYLCRKNSVLLVAVSDSRIVGYVAGTVRTSRVRSIAQLDSIAVLPIARQKGIGSWLLQHFIQEAGQRACPPYTLGRRACKMIMLEVAMANKEGLRFFSNRGFLKIRELPGYYGRGLDGVLMKLSV